MCGCARLLIGLVATVTAVVVGAVGADFGAAIYAEYRLASSVRTAAELGLDPSVASWVSRSSRRRCAATTTRWRSAPVA